TGLAGAVIAPSFLKGEKNDAEFQKKDRKFVYRTLGNTGIKLPVVSMGTYDATSLAEEALDEGIVHIDTSADYNEGNDERMFGELFMGRPRESYVIGTSIGMWQFRSAEQVTNGISPEKLKETFDGSLERLQLDFIDIYYLGGIQHKEIIENEPYLKVLRELKKSGKAKFMGVTTHSNEPEIIRLAADSDVFDVVLTRYNFRMNNIDEVNKAIQYAADKGMGIVAMKTQAGVYWDQKKKKEMINQKAALKWALQNENIHTAIPSVKNLDHLYENLSVMENLALTAQEKTDLKLDLGPQKSLTGLFCSECSTCLSQCPYDLDIPTAMRSYMYAYGYEQPAKARRTLDDVNIAVIPCSDCQTCRVVCPSGFDVKAKVLDIARLKAVPKEFLV
ncbi:MAG: aldo/keto reductase, partial [Candidatus Aminicenantes bacterium]|nr:aldo/keto reductase [Candidatus Aminicenantes bacterium]